MTDLTIPGTASTPTIRTDSAQGLLYMGGDSYPENSFELFGPVITKQALIHAGDIQPMSDEVKNRRQTKLANAQNK